MKVHELKTIHPYFRVIWEGFKPFEIRKNDRDFKVGDILLLREYDPTTKTYSGRDVTARVIYTLDKFEGLAEGYIAMGLALLDRNRGAYIKSKMEGE